MHRFDTYPRTDRSAVSSSHSNRSISQICSSTKSCCQKSACRQRSLQRMNSKASSACVRWLLGTRPRDKCRDRLRQTSVQHNGSHAHSALHRLGDTPARCHHRPRTHDWRTPTTRTLPRRHHLHRGDQTTAVSHGQHATSATTFEIIDRHPGSTSCIVSPFPDQQLGSRRSGTSTSCITRREAPDHGVIMSVALPIETEVGPCP